MILYTKGKGGRGSVRRVLEKLVGSTLEFQGGLGFPNGNIQDVTGNA